MASFQALRARADRCQSLEAAAVSAESFTKFVLGYSTRVGRGSHDSRHVRFSVCQLKIAHLSRVNEYSVAPKWTPQPAKNHSDNFLELNLEKSLRGREIDLG